MAATVEEIKLHEPESDRNPTDPVVHHDPADTPTGIVRSLDKEHEKEYLKKDAIYYPLVLYNNVVLENYQIKSLTLHYDGLVPRLQLIVSDPNGSIKFANVPGYVNILTLVMTPVKDGSYKKIVLNFYIESTTDMEDNIMVNAVWYTKKLYDNTGISAITYTGCSKTNKKPIHSCNPEPNKKPNTWEYLHTVANKTGLGFASTEGCNKQEDRMPRLQHNVSYIDDLYRNLEYAILDQNNIFDYWVDLYGYIVMVNTKAVIEKENIDASFYDIVANVGMKNDDDRTETGTLKKSIRTITNFRNLGAPSDMQFVNYRTLTDMSHVTEQGVSTQIMTLYQIGQSPNANNSFKLLDITQRPNSVDERKLSAHYDIQSQPVISIQQCERDMTQLKTIRDSYFSKLNKETLEIEMSQVNFGLQRGTLVNIMFYEYDAEKKRQIVHNADNIVTDNEEDPKIDLNSVDESNNSLTTKDAIMDADIPLPDMSRSGMYYIRSMKFTYDSESTDLKQFIYVVKKGQTTKYNNQRTIPRFEANAKQT